MFATYTREDVKLRCGAECGHAANALGLGQPCACWRSATWTELAGRLGDTTLTPWVSEQWSRSAQMCTNRDDAQGLHPVWRLTHDLLGIAGRTCSDTAEPRQLCFRIPTVHLLATAWPRN